MMLPLKVSLASNMFQEEVFDTPRMNALLKDWWSLAKIAHSSRQVYMNNLKGSSNFTDIIC